MPRGFSRVRRVEEQLRRDLAELISHEVVEPDLGMVSITEVKVSPDLNHAQIYFSVLQDDVETVEHNLRILQAYAKKMRSMLSKRMCIRRVPELIFIYDDFIQRGAALSHVIEEAIEEGRRKTGQYHTKTGDGEEGNG